MIISSETRDRGNELIGQYRQARYEFWKLACERAGREFPTFQSAEDWWENTEKTIEDSRRPQ